MDQKDYDHDDDDCCFQIPMCWPMKVTMKRHQQPKIRNLLEPYLCVWGGIVYLLIVLQHECFLVKFVIVFFSCKVSNFVFTLFLFCSFLQHCIGVGKR